MPTSHTGQLPTLLRGETRLLSAWINGSEQARVLSWVGTIVAGSACFGAAMGWWRAPEQAFYTAVKLPLVVLLTTLGNALLNSMLAPLLGMNIGLRQSLMAVLMSFTIAAAILGAASPILAFVVWNTAPLESMAGGRYSHSFLLLFVVAVIAFAGIAGNVRLLQLLQKISGDAVARKVLFAWLAGNLFLGSQLSWILRPFVGSPGLPVQFLRDNAFRGSFYEAVFWSLQHLFSH